MSSQPADLRLCAQNIAYLEALLESGRVVPEQMPADWQSFLSGLQQSAASADFDTGAADSEERRRFSEKQVSMLQFLNTHRHRGHRQADLDPLRQYKRPDVPELHMSAYDFNDRDMQTEFSTGSFCGVGRATPAQLRKLLRKIYCGSIGAEYMHIDETRQKRWLQERLESLDNGVYGIGNLFGAEQQRHVLQRLIAANALEQYLHKRYVGQKRFSLEGGESLIPLLDDLICASADYGVQEIVLGMAHRGRLNVLINVLGKLPEELFGEFEGRSAPQTNRSGDVKYHLGYSADVGVGPRSVHLSLAFNPSHLEIIDPVVEGSVRARQDRRRDKERHQVLPLLIHGDAAFASQGVVMETFNLSQTKGYRTGGTVHVIINNQIGFTTSDPLDSRSTLYCTDVAKAVQAPIFHVNADDPEALLYIGRLALDYRMEFDKDVVIDMVCYRRHGHSEADEPAATQPVMYQSIQGHPDVCQIYGKRLQEQGVIGPSDAERLCAEYVRKLEQNLVLSVSQGEDQSPEFRINFSRYKDTRWDEPADTCLPLDDIKRLSQLFTQVPEGFELHPSVARIMAGRARMGAGEIDADWGFAETLAYASLLEQGYPVRVSGQDSGRGTFFHRHAVLHNQRGGGRYMPLCNLGRTQADFLVINSTLSEEAVLAFEYGYSSAEPDTLVIWEAQFGDFANGAQVVFDQFLSSCESKWERQCGLVVMLPHGYDGQGPEHSSARLERCLQLCAEDNMQVCMPSTAAQMFHLLRRQILRPYRKPLIIISPKSLLRQKLSASPPGHLSAEGFRCVIDEIDPIDPARVERLLLCSGKVYYDLLQARRADDNGKIAILRMEQFYPFPEQEMIKTLKRYSGVHNVFWVQEEPRNQGAWRYIKSDPALAGCLKPHQNLVYVGRGYSAAPAVGSMSLHKEQQQQLVADALDLERLPAKQRRTA